MDMQPIPQFSESIRKKIPQDRWEYNGRNAHWILSGPIRLNTDEKAEVIAIYASFIRKQTLEEKKK